jgi:predicted SprT family Zn-dependent metalloprotease
MYYVPRVSSEVYRFYEYPSFDADRVIGGFYSRRPYDKLEATIAHEVAHAIQFFAYKKLNTSCKPHGRMFKDYYAMLRQKFINAKLPEQKALAADYQNYALKLQANKVATLSAVYA